jgi:hypothetical protein
MAVRTEEIPIASVGRRKLSLEPMALKRHANGGWSLSASVVVVLDLPDGRIVEFEREVHIQGIQHGRKKFHVDIAEWIKGSD